MLFPAKPRQRLARALERTQALDYLSLGGSDYHIWSSIFSSPTPLSHVCHHHYHFTISYFHGWITISTSIHRNHSEIIKWILVLNTDDTDHFIVCCFNLASWHNIYLFVASLLRSSKQTKVDHSIQEDDYAKGGSRKETLIIIIWLSWKLAIKILHFLRPATSYNRGK